ncbi:MAG: hypothetical protein GC161_12685 [Planctomycetaceae bacterium]|nr:hypothetical protein [Planctomycetaceae bacterium]
MSLFDFFFPEQAQASYLRTLANSEQQRARGAARKEPALDRRIAALEGDVGYLALVLGALLQKVDEKGVITRDEVRDTVMELDGIDGVKDGRLDVDILRGMAH